MKLYYVGDNLNLFICAFSSDFLQPHSAFLTLSGKIMLTAYLLAKANICSQMPKARSKMFFPKLHLQACMLAAKQRNLMARRESMDKWPHCLSQKQLCSFSYISLQPSVSIGRTGTPDQWSVLPASSGPFCKCCLLHTALYVPTFTHRINAMITHAMITHDICFSIFLLPYELAWG